MDWLQVSVITAFLLLEIIFPCLAETCINRNGPFSCSGACCGQHLDEYCCLSPQMIAGIVFGALAVLFLLTACILIGVRLCKKNKKTVRPTRTVTVVNNSHPQPRYHHQPPPYAHPFDYYNYNSSTANHGQTQSTFHMGPPGYNTPSVPPPSYAYVDPLAKHTSPYAVAAAAGAAHPS